MIWTAWNNGSHHRSGAGYGLRVVAADRAKYFARSWETVHIDLPGHAGVVSVEASVVKASFWGIQCRELISLEIGHWLLDEKHAPWPSRRPPKFEVEKTDDRKFRVIMRADR